MSAHDNLGAQFNLRDIPEPFGTTPIPEDHVRFNHYTTSAAVPSIKEHGLLRSAAHLKDGENYVFMTAGAPPDNTQVPVVEGHANANTFRQGGQLDIGSYGGERGGLGEHIKRMEQNHSTITSMQDIPRSQIIGVHEPWHQRFRYLQENPSMESDIMHGSYDNTGEKATDIAVAATKVALAGKVMLGGQLGEGGRRR